MHTGRALQRRRRQVLALLALLTAGAAPCAPAPKPTPRMVVGIIQSEPLGFLDDKGAPAGLHHDILRELSRRSGIAMDIHIMPKVRLVVELEVNNIDGAIMFPAQNTDAIAIDAGITEMVRLVALGKTGTPLRRYEDLVKARTVLLLGSTTFGAQFELDERLHKYRVTTYDQMISMFVQGRANVIAGNMLVLLFQLKKQHKDQLFDPSAFLFRNTANHLFIGKKSLHRDKAEALQKALQEMERDGAIEQILLKYQGNSWQQFKLYDER
ncbi:substrate-binding periplasmic protein [Rugamonas sp. CCM 8940]|uniref:substrate-binding periplasmic protein n=1 Tax=Rugamonas sp. CCM 8940 TaxID=2765359 RepID=UPI0018F42F1A|nr:transporter substrate-binding domain-containing protein [Rugamonas sp. CCM 8940]MBJ7312200.1 transporter substrate-binding domain-containing protein [Rugamonas sp. CCM 8940]